MKLFGMLYLASGCLLAILVLRGAHGIWNDFGMLALFTGIANLITAFLAYRLFRFPGPDAAMHKLLLVGCFLAGIGGGAYLYFT